MGGGPKKNPAYKKGKIHTTKLLESILSCFPEHFWQIALSNQILWQFLSEIYYGHKILKKMHIGKSKSPTKYFDESMF